MEKSSNKNQHSLSENQQNSNKKTIKWTIKNSLIAGIIIGTVANQCPECIEKVQEKYHTILWNNPSPDFVAKTPEELIAENMSQEEKDEKIQYTRIDYSEPEVLPIQLTESEKRDREHDKFLYERFKSLPFYYSDPQKTLSGQNNNISYFIRYWFAFYPEELIADKVKIVIIGGINHEELPESTVAFAKSSQNIMKLSASEKIDCTVIHHELIHLIFEHGNKNAWTKKWEEEFGQYKKPSSFARDYGMTNTFEDMATVWEYIFDLPTLKAMQASNWAKNYQKDEIFFRKLERLRQYLGEITSGKMDTNYWNAIDAEMWWATSSSQVKFLDGYDTQKYFDSKK